MLTQVTCDSKTRQAALDANLILDSYPGASLAFSLRRLRDAYNGYCVKVRRSSDNDEAFFGFVGDYVDTAGILDFCGNGDGFVVIWFEQSFGNGNYIVVAEQYSASNQPKIVNAGSLILSGGLPSISFDGVNDFFNFYLPYNLSVYNPYLFFAIEVKGDSSGQSRNGGIVTFYNLDPTFNSNHFGAEDDWYDGFFSTTRPQITSQNIPRARYIGELYQNGTQIVPYLNNNSLPAVSATINAATTLTYMTIGNPFPASNFRSNNNYQELILYKNNQTSVRAAIEANINNFYQVHWNGATASLLSTYPGAAAAYSLRALNGSYQGPLVRVRRSSDNKEANIYALYNGQLDVNAIQTFCSGTDGFVTTWYDQSGNGNNATQSTAANQPQIVSSGSVINVNSKPSLQFDGSNDFLTLSNISTNITYSGFQVVKRNSTSTMSVTLAGSSVNDSYLLWNFSDNNAYFRSSQGYITQSLNTTTQQLFTSININSGNMSMYNNASLLLSNTPTSLPGTDVMNAIGRRDANYGEGNTQEIIVYSSNQSSNRIGIESNINSYYGIY